MDLLPVAREQGVTFISQRLSKYMFLFVRSQMTSDGALCLGFVNEKGLNTKQSC